MKLFEDALCSVSNVSKVIDYGLDNFVSVSGRGRDFLQHFIQTGSKAYPLFIQSVLDVLFQRLKWSGCEADHPALPSAKMSYMWSYRHSRDSLS